MVNVRICELKKKEDLKLATHHNMVKGRVKVSFLNGTWSHRVLEFKPESYYEDESEPIDYDYDRYSKNYIIYGAYIDDKCVGFALMEKSSRTRYLYIKEVRTDAQYLSQGIGTKLLQHCNDEAIRMGYRGLYTVTPDNNLDSVAFYLYNGFRIGGLETEYYMGTANEGWKDIILYRG